MERPSDWFNNTFEEEIKKLEGNSKTINAQNSFWDFCKTMYPKFYKDNRGHLKIIADTLQALYEGKLLKKDDTPFKKLILNVPPRHAKSFTATNFTKWILGRNNENRVITVSYNETLSGRFAKAVRDGIEEIKADSKKTVFSDIFPKTKVRRGDGSYQMWSLEGQFFNYLATSPTATLTGVGCNVGIIDDIIKDKYEAYNENILENHWEWYKDTYLSRLEEGAIQIVIMTRWSTKDLCGRLLKEDPDDWYVLKMKAYDEETDEMLCPELLSKKSFEDKRKKTSSEIIAANYQQEPIDVKGALYKNLKTYSSLPEFEQIISYTDTADEGDDRLCSIVAGVYQGEGYILDVYYTDEGMEVTETETAKFLVNNKTNLAIVESNNGGKGFARNVLRIIWELFNTKSVVVKWFHQSKNKMARILTNSSFVINHIYFPERWRDKWPDFYNHITSFQKEGKNKHDDPEDALTGIAELIQGMKINDEDNESRRRKGGRAGKV